jgi:hypothetical protein
MNQIKDNILINEKKFALEKEHLQIEYNLTAKENEMYSGLQNMFSIEKNQTNQEIEKQKNINTNLQKVIENLRKKNLHLKESNLEIEKKICS